MPTIIFGYTAFLVLSLSASSDAAPSPIIEYDKGLRYEEYIVEHEISAGQAKNAALSIDLNSVSSPAGCQTCTSDEIKYCLGTQLINDHCCCDKKYHEVLPFIPHTCYLGTRVCQPVVSDCDEYSRLRSCCCDKQALQKWKKKSAGVRWHVNNGVVLAMMVHFVYISVYYHFYL